MPIATLDTGHSLNPHNEVEVTYYTIKTTHKSHTSQLSLLSNYSQPNFIKLDFCVCMIVCHVLITDRQMKIGLLCLDTPVYSDTRLHLPMSNDTLSIQ